MHDITIKYGSEGEYRDWHQNHCSCGWVGKRHYNYQSFAYIDLLQEAVAHQQAESMKTWQKAKEAKS